MDNIPANVYESVENAAKYLDKVVPNWYKHIDVNSLNLRHYSSCIIGQLNRRGIIDSELYFRIELLRDVFAKNNYLTDWKNEVAKRLKENTNKSVDQEKKANPPANAGDRILFYNFDQQQFYLCTLEEMELGDKIQIIKTKATDNDLELCNTVHKLVEEEC